MRRRLALAALVLAIFALALPVFAQRGGGRGGNPEATLTRTAYESPDKTLAFAVPPDVTLFTPDAPGRFMQVFKSGYLAYLINLVGKEITIGVKAMPGATEADLNGLRQTLDTNPPQAKQPGYKKLALGTAKVGIGQDKDAIDYIYSFENDKKVPMTTRQVAFLHGPKGYVITCTAPDKDFAAVNKKTFDTLFHSIELK
jgi:hypothetical protein